MRTTRKKMDSTAYEMITEFNIFVENIKSEDNVKRNLKRLLESWKIKYGYY
ncbi:MAG: hypothetical protein HWN67_08620 [Candidatus Helarchaeota archaeon]|nr:hypothetical protein [Candidatus Helarchaeota archaeon]